LGATGDDAVVRACALLDRLGEIESGASRNATRKADAAALKTLAGARHRRGRSERARLRKLGVAAQSVAAPSPLTVAPDVAQRERDLLALHAWYEDWSETARVLLTRREHSMRVGLAKRIEHFKPCS
jgi:hypothetical protein